MTITDTYTPRGRVAVLFDWMRARPGRTFTTEQLAEAHGSAGGSMQTILRTAVQRGAIFRRRMPGKEHLLEWGLEPFEGQERPPARLVGEEGAQAEEEEPGLFDAALWADGGLVLVGAETLPDGNVFLRAGQAAKVKALLNGEVV